MSLERVIAEQQAEVDGLKQVVASQQKSIETVFTRHNELFESFGKLVGAKIPDKSNEAEWRKYCHLVRDCRLLMGEAGFCCRCMSFSCECEYE